MKRFRENKKWETSTTTKMKYFPLNQGPQYIGICIQIAWNVIWEQYKKAKTIVKDPNWEF